MGIYEYKANSISGDAVSMEQFQGKVLLVVNTASKCGFTPQYKGLEALYQKYRERRLVILGFPCNQFGHQEPGDAEQITDFCERNYGVSFPLFEKVDVNGKDAHPLFGFLKQEAPGLLGSTGIKWNFTKFLVAPDGRVVKRFAPNDKPESIEPHIEALL